MRYSLVAWNEAVDFIPIEDIGDPNSVQWFMYRSWATFDGSRRIAEMPLSWQCCAANST